MVVSKEVLQIGSLYMLMHAHGYFIGNLIAIDQRYSQKRTATVKDGKEIVKKELSQPQYLITVLKGVDTENCEKFGIISKIFHREDSDEQNYFTNHLLFDNLFVRFDSYSWLINHMLGVNAFKIDKRNSKVAYDIALSMFYKESPLAEKKLVDKFIKLLLKKVSEELADEIEARIEAVKLNQLNQLPF